MHANKLKTLYKIVGAVCHIMYGCVLVSLWLPFLKSEAKQSTIQRWSQGMLAVLNIRLRLEVDKLANHIIVTNHVSWLDVFILSSMMPCRFVAKSEIRSWPVIGWLAKKVGTIYLAHDKKRDVGRVYHELIEKIKEGERIVFFPEGKVGPQGHIQPFHSNFFEVAVYTQTPIQPMVIRYLDEKGALTPSVRFNKEMGFIKSFFNIASAPSIQAELYGLPLIKVAGAHRRLLAKTAEIAIGDALAILSEQPINTHLSTLVSQQTQQQDQYAPTDEAIEECE